MDILEQVKRLVEKFEAEKLNLVNKLKESLPSIIASIFKDIQRIDYIGWNQYTDYFNDGDPTTFHVYADVESLYTNGSPNHSKENEFLEEELYAGNHKYIKNESFDPEARKAVEKISEVLNSIPDDFMEDIFGDHITVMINKKGEVTIEEYDHD